MFVGGMRHVPDGLGRAVAHNLRSKAPRRSSRVFSVMRLRRSARRIARHRADDLVGVAHPDRPDPVGGAAARVLGEPSHASLPLVPSRTFRFRRAGSGQ